MSGYGYATRTNHIVRTHSKTCTPHFSPRTLTGKLAIVTEPVENKTKPLDECVWTFIHRLLRSSGVFPEKAQTLERNAETELNGGDVWRKQEATNCSVSLFFFLNK